MKRLESIPVVHLIVYLAQYKQLSKSMYVVETETIEVSCDVPLQNDAAARTQSVRPMLSDLILDFDNVHELTRYTNRDASGSMEAALDTFTVPDTMSESLTHGLTLHELVNEIIRISILMRTVLAQSI
jgi:hypothetical protein